MSIFDTLKTDWSKFGGVVVKDEQEFKTWAEGVFGAGNADSAIARAEQVASTELGAIAKDVVPFIESTAGKLVGSAKSSMAGSIIITVAKALGVPFDQTAINTVIETFVPFLAKAALGAATAGL